MSARSRIASLALTALTAAVAGFGYEKGRKAGLADQGKWVNTFASLAPGKFMDGAGNGDMLTNLLRGNLTPDDLARLKAEVRWPRQQRDDARKAARDTAE